MKPIKVLCKKNMTNLHILDKVYNGQWDKQNYLLTTTAEDGKKHTYKICLERNQWFEEIE